MKPGLAATSVAALLLAATSAGAANLLTNGGFEDPSPANNFAGYYRGPSAPAGWNAVAGYETPDIVSNGYTQSGAGFEILLGAEEGVRFLDTNGASPTGALSQDVTGLAAGSLLTLTYWVGQWAQNTAGTLLASLTDATNSAALGSQTTTIAYAPGATSAAWTMYTLTAYAPASGAVRVTFSGNSGSTSRGAPGLDNVSLTAGPGGAVPEPGTWALMIGGFGLAGAALRRTSSRRPAAA